MIITEEQIIEQAAEDFEEEFHVKVKHNLSPSGWFMFNNEDRSACAFITKPADLYQTFAVYDVENRPWEICHFIKKDLRGEVCL